MSSGHFLQALAIATFLGFSACAFDLADVEALAGPGDGGPELPVLDADGTSDQISETSLPDGADASDGIAVLDGCFPPTDQDLCAQSAIECGPLTVVDDCGQPRHVDCDCSSTAFCEANLCIEYAYAWNESGWSACSVQCGGGTETQVVTCKRNDGETVADALCPSPKPDETDSCNTQDCCSTESPMHSGKRCEGGVDSIVNAGYPLWAPNAYSDGDAADQADCAAQCTAWGSGYSLGAWCCDLQEKDGKYTCAIHTTTSFTANSSVDFASRGSCQSP